MSAPFITKEEIAQFVKAYADAHPGTDNVIKNAMGSNGTTWGDYNEGLMAFCNAMEQSINEKVQVRLDAWQLKVKAMRDTLVGQWTYALENRINWCIDMIKKYHTSEYQAPMNLDDIPNIPEI